MKTFEYIRPKTVEDAIGMRKARAGSMFLAGGSNLLDLMKYGVEAPDQVVDINHLPLDRIEEGRDGGLSIGALVRNSDCAAHERVRRDYPVLAEAILAGASPQLRNMATTGGNLLQRTRCYYFYDPAFPCNKRKPGSGCPAIGGFNRIHAILGQSDQCIAVYPSDMAVAMALLDAVVHTQGPKGSREISIHEFHRLPGDHPEVDNTLDGDELILSVELPKPAGLKTTYVKVRDRNSYAFALVSVAAGLRLEGGTIKEARIALGGVAAKPWRALDAERALVGKSPAEENLKAAAEAALSGAKGYEHNAFKIELAKRTIVRALKDLAA